MDRCKPRKKAPRAPRSKRGCLMCRRRKIKCDEIKPICGRCKIRSRSCTWPETAQSEAAETIPDAFLTLDTQPSLLPAPLPDLFSFQDQTLDSFLDHDWLNEIASAPPPAKFYVPPDFLPKTTPKVSEGVGPWMSDFFPAGQKAIMMADPAFLQPYFPSIEERVLMRHYILHTAHQIMAYEHPRRQWNPLLDHLAPLCLSKQPGVSSACDALRAGMLSCAAIHLRYQTEPNDHSAAIRILGAAKARILFLLQQVVDAQTPTNLLESSDIEVIMSALLVCTIASGLAADESWHELLLSIVAFVESLGGPQKILEICPRDKMSPLRFCCEQLAIRDVFACFYIPRAPRILDQGSSWFSESQQWSQTDDEWESTERMFGISRGMIMLLAKANAVIAKVRDMNVKLASSDTGSVFSMRIPDRGKPTSPAASPIDPARDAIVAEVRQLMDNLDDLGKSSGFTPLHPRTQYADHAYRHAILIRLWTDVFGVHKEDGRVQKASHAIIELATELVLRYHRVTWLTWPVVVAGTNLVDGDSARDTVRYLLSEFKRFACFSVPKAHDVLERCWTASTTLGQAVTGLQPCAFY